MDPESVGGKEVANVSFVHDNGSEEKSQLIIAYKGTANDLEWADNGQAMYYDVTDTPQLKAALDFFDKEVADWDGNVLTDGHSKGGNKAQYVTLMRGDLNKINQSINNILNLVPRPELC